MPETHFISYARSDVGYAEVLECVSNERGLVTWRDQSQIESDWSREIAEALAASSSCCLVWTYRAEASKWVRHEWLTARLARPST